MKFNKIIFDIVDEGETSTLIGRAFNSFIVSIIILNVIALILHSFESINKSYQRELDIFELISVIIFSLEYLMRLYASNLKFKELPSWKARFKYIFSFMALVDLLAVLPFYLPAILGIDLSVLKVFRVLRLLKLSRYSTSLILITKVVKEKRFEVGVTVILTLVLLTISSTLMYFAEGDIQPDAFPNIIESMWWGVITLTTVGYGDIVPVTPIGKIIGGFISLMGIGLVALPTSILSAAFIENINKVKQKQTPHVTSSKWSKSKDDYCPHCGKELNEDN